MAESLLKMAPLSLSRTNNLTQAITKFIVNDLRPISIISGQGFRDMLKLFEPKYTVPSRQTITVQIPKMYDEVAGKLKHEISVLDNIAITYDMQTCLNTESYATMTCHYITDKWVLKSCILETKLFTGQHTADNIATAMEETRVHWGLPGDNDIVAITDNAGNEAKALANLG